jgi:mannose-6-phosphate isomerase-like protein (cupin superfamily)
LLDEEMSGSNVKSHPIRRVVTRVSEDGFDSIVSDDHLPNAMAGSRRLEVSELLWLDGPRWDLMTSIDRTRDRSYVLPPGGLSSKIVRCPPNHDWRTPPPELREKGCAILESLDLLYMLEGSLTIALEEEELTLGGGDVVIQQGGVLRWRVDGGEPVVILVTTMRPQPGFGGLDLPVVGGSSGLRRVITGGGSARVDEAPGGRMASGNAMSEIWQTGGPLVSVAQGGDAPGPFDLGPAGGGVALRYFELVHAAVDDQPNKGWHTTDTVDVDVILSGRMALELPFGQRVELGVGDSVVQGGTKHRWIPLGDETVRLVTLMVAMS